MWFAWSSENENGSAIRFVARVGPVLRGTNRRDHRVEHVDRTQQPLDDVGAVARLPQAELRPARHDLDLVGDVAP